jgi:hypothetical protein
MPDQVDDDPEWRQQNPFGFEYLGVAAKQAGFVDSYAATNAVEDRASVYQYMMARPDELCEIAQKDPIVRTKSTIIWHRVAAVAGDGFLRARASCIDWIDAPR